MLRSLVGPSDIALIVRPAGRSPNDGCRERSAWCRPTPCRLALEQQRTAAGSGAGGRAFRPSRTRDETRGPPVHGRQPLPTERACPAADRSMGHRLPVP